MGPRSAASDLGADDISQDEALELAEAGEALRGVEPFEYLVELGDDRRRAGEPRLPGRPEEVDGDADRRRGAHPPADRQGAVLCALCTIHPGGSTDLAAGYLRGLQEVQRAVGSGTSARLLLVSDGHANAGLTDPDHFAALAAKAGSEKVTTCTVRGGLGHDESCWRRRVGLPPAPAARRPAPF